VYGHPCIFLFARYKRYDMIVQQSVIYKFKVYKKYSY
jgi:hypothetical protein